jgi:hypothetical protein
VLGSDTGVSTSAVPTTAKELGSMVLASIASEKVAWILSRFDRLGSITSVSLGSMIATEGDASLSTMNPKPNVPPAVPSPEIAPVQ